jgi:hypothetical protein
MELSHSLGLFGTHVRIEFAGLGVVFIQHTIAECIGSSICMILDIQSGAVERHTIRSANFKDDTRNLERDVHEHAVRREGEACCLSRESTGTILENSEEATLRIATMHATIITTVLAEVQDTVGGAVAKVEDTGNLVGLRIEHS